MGIGVHTKWDRTRFSRRHLFNFDCETKIFIFWSAHSYRSRTERLSLLMSNKVLLRARVLEPRTNMGVLPILFIVGALQAERWLPPPS